MSARTHWLTTERLTAHGILLGLAMWAIYAWTLATPGWRDRNENLKGTDFLHFYTLGSLARARDGTHLYDMRVQSGLAAQRVPAAAGTRYLPLYPPQVSLIFAPFAALSYGQALVWWWTLSAAIYGLCCYGIWRTCTQLRGHGILVLILAIGFPAFFNLIAWGQTSALALACFTGMFLLLDRQQAFVAGLVLGCLIFKPQLGIAAVILFIALGSWKVVAGAFVSSVVELSVGAFYYGVAPLREWVHTLLQVRSVVPLLEPRPYQTHSLRTFWSMILPWEHIALAFYGISAALVLALTFSVWRRGSRVPMALRYSALLLATVLISPHLTVYDLVILAPCVLLLADWSISQNGATQNRMGTLLYLVYALPLLAQLTRWTHVQLSVVAMAVLLYMVWKTSRKISDIGEITPGVPRP